MELAIAEALLMHIYWPVSAVISFDENDVIFNVSMFDTEFAGERICPDKNAAKIWLMSNHPEGFKAPYETDLVNLSRIWRKAPSAKIRLFITGEDIGVLEFSV